MYNVHKNGAKIVDKLYDATSLQKYFLMLMSGEDIQFMNSIEHKLVGIAKGVGVEFKGNNSRRGRMQSNNFRERMKQKQMKRGVNIG